MAGGAPVRHAAARPVVDRATTTRCSTGWKRRWMRTTRPWRRPSPTMTLPAPMWRKRVPALLPQISAGASMTANRQSERRPLRSANQPNQYPSNIVDAASTTISTSGDGCGTPSSPQKAAAQASAADLATMRLSLHAEVANDYASLRGLDAQENLLAQTVADYQRALDHHPGALRRQRSPPASMWRVLRISWTPPRPRTPTSPRSGRCMSMRLPVWSGSRRRRSPSRRLSSRSKCRRSRSVCRPPCCSAGPDIAAAERRVAAANATGRRRAGGLLPGYQPECAARDSRTPGRLP